MDSSEETYGYVDITCYGVVPLPLPFTSEETFCACVVGKVSLTLRMRNMKSLSLGRAQLLPLAIVFTLECLSTGTQFHLISLGPVYLLPQKVFPSPGAEIFFSHLCCELLC